MKRADIVSAALAMLYERHGVLTPEVVVRSAESPKSPLHDLFEWNDSDAAKSWRENQARELIRSVKIEVRTTTSVIEAVAYVRDPKAGARDQGYVSVEQVRLDPAQATEALRYEVTRAVAGLNRARHLALVLGLEGEVDRIVNEMEEMVAPAA